MVGCVAVAVFVVGAESRCSLGWGNPSCMPARSNCCCDAAPLTDRAAAHDLSLVNATRARGVCAPDACTHLLRRSHPQNTRSVVYRTDGGWTGTNSNGPTELATDCSVDPWAHSCHPASMMVSFPLLPSPPCALSELWAWNPDALTRVAGAPQPSDISAAKNG